MALRKTRYFSRRPPTELERAERETRTDSALWSASGLAAFMGAGGGRKEGTRASGRRTGRARTLGASKGECLLEGRKKEKE